MPFNKTTLLADIASKCLRVVATTEDTGDTLKNAAGVRSYITHIMEQDGNAVTGRNIGWYTIDEGTAQEQAYYRDNPKTKRNFRDAVDAYLKTITPNAVQTGTYIRAEVLTVNEAEKNAEVKAYKKNADATATPVTLLVYRNGAQAITHVEIA